MPQHLVVGIKGAAQGLDLAVRIAAQNTNADGAAIALLENNALVCRARFGDLAPDLGIQLNADVGITGACVRARCLINCPDTYKDDHVDPEVCRRSGIRSVLVIPIIKNGAVIAVCEVLSRQKNAFGSSHEQALQMIATVFWNLSGSAHINGSSDSVSEDNRECADCGATSSESQPTHCTALAIAPADLASGGNEGPEVFRGVLDRMGSTSSWDTICNELVCHLKE